MHVAPQERVYANLFHERTAQSTLFPGYPLPKVTNFSYSGRFCGAALMAIEIGGFVGSRTTVAAGKFYRLLPVKVAIALMVPLRGIRHLRSGTIFLLPGPARLPNPCSAAQQSERRRAGLGLLQDGHLASRHSETVGVPSISGTAPALMCLAGFAALAGIGSPGNLPLPTPRRRRRGKADKCHRRLVGCPCVDACSFA